MALDRPYHPACLTCQRCNCALPSAFSPVNGAPHCAECARALLAAHRRPTNAAPSAQGGAAPAASAPAPGSKRHSKRASQRVAPPCAKCSKPLSGAVIEALGKSYHEACFGCTQCGAAVTATFVQIGGQPFCDPCAKARFSKELRARSAQPEPNPLTSSAGASPSRSQPSQSSAPTKTQTSAAAPAPATGGASQWRGGLAHGTQALLEWCQANTKGYAGVEVRNWTTSWQDGLALCALIHHFHPSLINFTSLRAANALANIKLGIATAKRLGVPELLDAEDFGIEKLSMCTYVSELYKKVRIRSCIAIVPHTPIAARGASVRRRAGRTGPLSVPAPHSVYSKGTATRRVSEHRIALGYASVSQ